VNFNHNQSLERALEIIDAAAASGAHALKLQTYTADTMTLDLAEGEFFIEDPNSRSMRLSVPRARPAAKISFCSNAPAPIRPRLRTPIS